MNKDDLLEEIAEHYLDSFRKGNPPPFSYYVRKCPSLESEIVDLLKSLKSIERFGVRETNRKNAYEKERITSRNIPALDSLGDFEIVRQIGRGGMGTVYLAADKVLDRKVALKVLDVPSKKKSDRLERFQREARLASRLHHTNIVPVFGVGSEKQYFYYAMQFINGVDVRQIIDALKDNSSGPNDFSVNLFEHAERLIGGHEDSNFEAEGSTGDGRLSSSGSVGQMYLGETDSLVEAIPKSESYWLSVAKIGAQVADALSYAHNNGIVHRDIKPSNLLMDRNGTVWVTDFGLAKFSEDDDLTQTDDVLGTLRYMAPEQLSGKHSAASDIYSLGVTLYELLTLRPACDATDYATLLSQKKDAAFKVPHEIDRRVPRDLETIILKAMHPDAKGRYKSAVEFAEDLRAFLADRPIQARRSTFVERTVRWCRKNKQVAALLATVVCLLAVLPIVLGVAYYRESTERERAEEILVVAMDGLEQIFNSVVDRDQVLSENEVQLEESASQVTPLRITPESGSFLAGMLTLYDKLAERNSSGNTQLLAATAKASWRVAEIFQILGQYDEALAAYDHASEKYAELATVQSNQMIELASIKTEQGKILAASDHPEEAKTAFEAALSLLSGQDSSAASAQLLLARIHLQLGKPKREGPLRKPGPEARIHEGFDRFMRGFLPRRDDEPEDWEAPSHHLLQALQIIDRLLEQDPRSDRYKFLRALCLREFEGPGVIDARRRPKRAEATAVLRALVDENPDELNYRFELSQTLRSVSPHRVRRHELRETIDQLMEAKKLSEALVKDADQVAIFRINLAHIYANLGMLCEADGDWYEAEANTRKAVQTHRMVADRFPGLSNVSRQLVTGPTLSLARVLMRRGQDFDAALSLEGLHHLLTQTLKDQELAPELRAKAEEELELCEEMQSRIDLDRPSSDRPNFDWHNFDRHNGPPGPPVFQDAPPPSFQDQ